MTRGAVEAVEAGAILEAEVTRGAAEAGAILEAEATSQDNNEATRVRSLELLLKVHGGFAPEKTEVTSFEGTFLADLDEDPAQVPNAINDLH